MEHLRTLSILAVLFATALASGAPELSEANFRQPADNFGSRTWWHWLDGNITRTGITKDLEAFRTAGITHATLFDLGIRGIPGPVQEVLSPEWFDLVRFAAAEARRVGIKLGLTIHPGFSGAGGPWIKPALSMKQLVWSDMVVEGGHPIAHALPQLPVGASWFKDFAVLAWPTSRSIQRTPVDYAFNGKPVVGVILADGNPHTSVPCPRATPTWRITARFVAPKIADRIQILFTDRNHFGYRSGRAFIIQVTADGRPVAERTLTPEELREPFTVQFPSTAAQDYTVEIRSETGAYDFSGMLFLSELEVLAADETPQWSGAIKDWQRQVGQTTGKATAGGSFAATGSRPVDPRSVQDLTNAYRDGVLSWTPPAGQWRIVRFAYKSTEQQVRPSRLGGRGLESDKMSAAATDMAFRGYPQRVLKAVAAEDRQVFDLLLIDSWEAGKQNWTDDFAAEFERRRGYSLLPYLPAMAGEIVDTERATARMFDDFRATIADLITERYYARARELANGAGLKLEAQVGDGKGVDPDWDIFALARAVDIPMDEFWTEVDNETTPRAWLLAEAAALAGRPVATAESLTGRKADWRNTPGDFTRWADLATLRGVGQFALHSSVLQTDYKPPGLTLAGNGEHFTPLNTWWPLFGDWLQGIRRSHYLLQVTAPTAELLVYHGDTMPRPAPLSPPSFAPPHRYFVDADALLRRVTVTNGRLRVDGRGNFRALILPQTVSMRVDVVEKMAALVKAGAVLIGPPPAYATGLLDAAKNDSRMAGLRRKLWVQENVPHAWGKGRVIWTDDVASALALINFTPDVVSHPHAPADMPVEYGVRYAPAADVFLLVNPNEQRGTFTCELIDARGRRPELWNARIGEIRPLSAYAHAEGKVIFPLTLEAHESIIVVLRGGAQRGAITAVRGMKDDRDRFSGADGIEFLSTTATRTIVMGEAAKTVYITDATGRDRELSVPPPRRFTLTSPWRVTFGAGKSPLELAEPVSWTDLQDPEVRDFSGIARYETSFQVAAGDIAGAHRVELDLVDVSVAARVFLNGEKIDTRWRAPWRFDISKQLRSGANVLRVEVANTWVNRIVADAKLPEAGRITFTTPQAREYLKTATPLRSGLLAPAQLVIFNGVEL